MWQNPREILFFIRAKRLAACHSLSYGIEKWSVVPARRQELGAGTAADSVVGMSMLPGSPGCPAAGRRALAPPLPGSPAAFPAQLATPEMCAFCFDCLLCALVGRPPPPEPRFVDGRSFPLFVTFETDSVPGVSPVLRGCIGSLSACSLGELRRYTHCAAFEDERFSPMAFADLVPALFCKVSLLHSYERAHSAFDFEVGRHGIIIDFDATCDGRRTHYNATYLPEIATEQGWDKQQCLSTLVRKAGFTGKIDQALLNSIQLTRYSSSRCRLGYPIYLSCRQSPLAPPPPPRQPMALNT